MKSEKARQELDDGSWKVEVGFEDEEFDLPYYAVRVDVAQYAVEIAEQEAEERMRKKAEEAFLSYCYCEEHQYVRKKCENCEAYKSFIQELNEE